MRVFPGPWYSKFTNLVLKYYVLNGKRLHYIHRLHQRYGSVVRIAPYEADFADLESFREIHKIANGFLKSPWYQSFRDQPALDIFTLTDPKAHAARRRLMARPFSYSSLREHWEDLVRDMLVLLCAVVMGRASVLNTFVGHLWPWGESGRTLYKGKLTYSNGGP